MKNASTKDFSDPIIALHHVLQRLSTQQVAKRLGVDRVSVWRWASGRGRPHARIRRALRRLAERTQAGVLPGCYANMRRFGVWAKRRRSGTYRALAIDRAASNPADRVVAKCKHKHQTRREAHNCAKLMLLELFGPIDEDEDD